MVATTNFIRYIQKFYENRDIYRYLDSLESLEIFLYFYTPKILVKLLESSCICQINTNKVY
jgi:hypothetical protein